MRSARPASATIFSSTPWAVGLRQMFPVQTMRILFLFVAGLLPADCSRICSINLPVGNGLHDISMACDAKTLAGIFHADRKSTRLNSSHSQISYAVFCLKKKNFVDVFKDSL